MRIEILNTGSELLLGTTLNTHGHWFGQQLFDLGLRVQRLTTVPDGDAIRDALAECVLRADVVLVTGGLGPTSDDITREATAEVLGVELIEDEAALRSLEAFFARLEKHMAPDNRKQAQVPVGADVLPNANGTAPGIYVPPRLNGAANCAVFLLPGPPRELYPMFADEVAPRLRSLSGIENCESILELKMTGVGESDLHQAVDEPLSRIEGLEIGYCARPAEVDLRLIGSPEAISEGRELVLAQFPDECFAEDGSTLEAVVVRALSVKGWKLATAESCTGGYISHRITNVPGSSEVFTHGFVTYANEAKVELLGVDESLLKEHGAVSEPVVRQMAEGALRASGADIAVAVTGIAGPGGGTDEKPVGTVFLAVSTRGGKTEVQRRMHLRDRIAFKQTVSQGALDLVRCRIRSAEQEHVAQVSDLRMSGTDSGSPVEVSPAISDPNKFQSIAFKPFKKEGIEVARSRRRLPHWEQEGACYFVTFRTADSMPKQAMDAWLRKRAQWLELRGIRIEGKKSPDLTSLSLDDRREYSRVFEKAMHSELDRGAGQCLLSKAENAQIVANTLRFFDGERYQLGDFVVMPNHVHVLVVPKKDHALSEILKSWKGFSARQINLQEGREGAFWQAESWDHMVRSRKQLERFQSYIAENPKMAGLSEEGILRQVVEWSDEGSDREI